MSDDQNGALEIGLRQFYSSQVDVMLAQYRNINNLLGPTTHHTHPGTHCEVLLRNCLRTFLRPGWSADKGFVYGRILRQGENTHSPEIDILIHNESNRRPLFRLDDFVIVDPRSVVATIQVKRSFAGSALRRGITNVVDAKQHLLELARDRQTGKLRYDRRCFSAVIAFEGDLPLESLNRCLSSVQGRQQVYERPSDAPWNVSVLAMPDVVGTLAGQVALDTEGASSKAYEVFDSVHEGTNLVIQLLLWKLGRVTPDFPLPPFAFPQIKPKTAFRVVPDPSVSDVEPDSDTPTRMQTESLDGDES